VDVEQIEAAQLAVNAKLEPGGRAFKSASLDIIRLSPSYEQRLRGRRYPGKGEIRCVRDPLRTALLWRGPITPSLQLPTAVDVQENRPPRPRDVLFRTPCGNRARQADDDDRRRKDAPSSMLRQTCRELSTNVWQVSAHHAVP
jgi:hypothetical protein